MVNIDVSEHSKTEFPRKAELPNEVGALEFPHCLSPSICHPHDRSTRVRHSQAKEAKETDILECISKHG